MNLELFRKMPTIRDVLFGSDYIFTASNMFGKVSFEESVNAGDDLTVGSCVISTIEFQLENLNYLINGLAGKELVWKQAILTGKTSYQRLAKTARSNVMCVHGDVAYAVNSRQPYLSIWDVQNVVKHENLTVALPIYGLVIQGNMLYCLHKESPYLTAYSIADKTLTSANIPALNAYFIEKIQYLCRHGYAANLQGNILKEYSVSLENLSPIDLIEFNYEYVQMGVFVAQKPTKINDTKIKVQCYDRMIKFDQYVDEWLNQIKYPLTLKEYLSGLCRYVGVEWNNVDFVNSTYPILENFAGENVSGLQVLRWIAEAGAGFGQMDRSGKLSIGWYRSVNFLVDNSIYTSAEVEDYVAPAIEKVQIRVTENDIGVAYPSDDTQTEALIINDNPLLYAESVAQLTPVARNIFQAVKEISYQPYSVKLQWEIPLLRAGDIIEILTKKGQRFPAYIMSRSLKSSADTIEATGGKKRETQSDAVHQQITRLRGKSNELNRTIEETRVEMKDANGKLETKIAVTATEIRQEVSAGDKNLSSIITQTATEIRQEVSAGDKNLSSIITQTATALEGKINDNAGNISSIKLTINGFEAAVNNSKLSFSAEGLKITNGGFRINNGKEDVFYIDSEGMVQTIGSLTTVKRPFSTKISGGLIETRNINTNTLYFSIRTDGVFCLSLSSEQEIKCGLLNSDGAISGTSLNVEYGTISGGSLNVSTGTVTCMNVSASGTVNCASVSASGTISCTGLSGVSNFSATSGSFANLTVNNSAFAKRTASIPNSSGFGSQIINYWGY